MICAQIQRHTVCPQVEGGNDEFAAVVKDRRQHVRANRSRSSRHRSYATPPADHRVRLPTHPLTVGPHREIIRCLKRFLAHEIYQRIMTDFRTRHDITNVA